MTTILLKWARLGVVVGAILCATMSVRADSLWSPQAEAAGSLFSDKQVQYHIGDVIMVMVSETTTAETTAGTDTDKQSKLTAKSTAPSLTDKGGLNILKQGQIPNWDLNGQNTFKSDGTTRRENTLTTVVSVQVKEITSTGNLRVEGSKTVTVNRERTNIHIKGIIRPADVTARNTVLSSQLAEGEILIEGQGPLWNTQRRGLLTKLLDWVWPF